MTASEKVGHTFGYQVTRQIRTFSLYLQVRGEPPKGIEPLTYALRVPEIPTSDLRVYVNPQVSATSHYTDIVRTSVGWANILANT